GLIYDRRRPDYDPLLVLLERCQDQVVDTAGGPTLADLPLLERIAAQVVQGNGDSIEGDLAEALAAGHDPLELINQTLLGAMAQVGDLFGDGRLQLPFVLRSAEVMKQAVAVLEPHVQGSGVGSKGTMLLATVSGDVHDIGKNLVDIILSNNGYKVVNLGVKQPIGQILAAAQAHDVTAIGLSGLLVKSTQVMRDNLAEMNLRGLARRWPVILGGAALTRAYVETDLRDMFHGQVYYAKDAFEALDLLSSWADPEPCGVSDAASPALGGAFDAANPPPSSAPDAAYPPPSSAPDAVSPPPSGTLGRILGEESPKNPAVRSTRPEGGVAAGAEQGRLSARTAKWVRSVENAPVPEPPFWGSRVTKGIALTSFEGRIDPRSLFIRHWGLKAGAGERTVEQLIDQEGWPRYRALMDQVRSGGMVRAGIVHGYFPVRTEGETLTLLDPADRQTVLGQLTFPRQPDGNHLALTDYFAPEQIDVMALQAVTLGPGIQAAGQELFHAGHFRQYMELTGLGAELAEALADFSHDRIRQEWGLAPGQGARYSLGFPAAPDLAGRQVIAQVLQIDRIGLELTEGFQLDPPQSTDALIVHHPEATYFSVRPVTGPEAGPENKTTLEADSKPEPEPEAKQP
ncbi:MAG: B12-binding domain-containing protein, partial [Micrococcales bacterium]|nr:B12-binding domain-containing protein [Micrococcales bacterium]